MALQVGHDAVAFVGEIRDHSTHKELSISSTLFSLVAGIGGRAVLVPCIEFRPAMNHQVTL